ncbi:exodeoxyribonuclease V alpha subunit [Bathymodiolus platifrons methanotrophic gill symbiont]|uniref:SF1B family DNA helicase RecD2 n=1 Tax=Bathymodiolus platifrons methanotrophic gill symbiont TaxID=113268 RepID=UPI000B4112C6|nr:AAA family ATPase [Bathymodiolus platifrons methanotrophic gill symbiont]MCK5869144.1 AAA family ATPase [Methyloprofundus sp.]GAW87553.1 exodeoxyribonuclease V alpha subunit [Bathymodiolus platifrons methanotrophic gill symbiont]
MNTITEVLKGIVNRVTYHNPTTGWSVLRLQPFQSPQQQETVTVHQTKVFAGATMEFRGAWTIDHKYGRQFKATEAIEKKPATTAAIEKYLGSGLIKGIGPQTAKKIVKYFQKETLDIFENDIKRLTEVPGIATKKLKTIEDAWTEHRAIREVMMFLQGHGISTLFAVRIYKQYGDKAIAMVTEDPYRLANDFYGIGFFSADKVALSIGLSKDSQQRMVAAIKHVLAASREQGHCYLTEQQINQGIVDLIEMNLGERLDDYLGLMQQEGQLCTRQLNKEGVETTGYYSKTLYYDETTVATILRGMKGSISSDPERIANWISHYCQIKSIALSDEQADAVKGVVQHRFSVLTGGPGCGKTTTTLVIVRLLEAMKKSVLLAAPTGRASQRMSEVIGREAKTIHRLLEWKGGEFQINEESRLKTDFLIIDECSMLDISLTASLLKAVPDNCQVLFIGDPDQLPSVGAGNVLKDIISSELIPCFRLTQVFRQAKESLIIQYAHQINKGETPYISSPFKTPDIWKNGADCLFIDSDEATQEQLGFITRVKRHFDWHTKELENLGADKVNPSPFEFRIEEAITSAYEVSFVVPDKFKHVDLEQLTQTDAQVDALKSVVKKIHPWSSLHYGLSAVDSVVKLYLEWIPKYHGAGTEIQILTPMTRGSLGSANLNKVIQEKSNPPHQSKCQLKVGERIFREGDRVIHRRNNYDLNVFNGDIGKIITINNEELTAMVSFYPDNREVHYKKEDIMELDLAYAITIHKSQGSEFKAVIIPILTQHFKMLYRNLIYTGLTRAKDLAVFVGTRRALSMAIMQQDVSQRQTALENLIKA